MAPRRLTIRIGWFGVAGALAGVLASFHPTPSVAQTPPPEEPAPHPCDAQTDRTHLVCRAGYDAIIAMIPAAALTVGGGNPNLSGAGGGKRFGDIGLSVRLNYSTIARPSTFFDGTTDTVRLVKRLGLAVPSVGLRFGILNRTLPAGSVSLDLLANVFGIPRKAAGHLRFGSDVRSVADVVLGFGYGLRIGFEPKPPLPTASLNVTKHDFPAFTYGDISSGSNYAYTMAVSAINARLLVGKAFGKFELTGGGGADLLKGSFSVVYRDLATGLPTPRADSSESLIRFLVLTNAGLRVGSFARLTVEGGFQIGKDEKLPTIFQGNNTKSGRFFGGVGLGFKL